MAGVSSIDRLLGKEGRTLIHQWFENGATVDEVTAHLREAGAPVSRSAVGRKRREWGQIIEQVREARESAEVLARTFKDAPSSEMAQANIEMMHALIQRLLRAESLKESVTLKPNELMFLTKAVQGLTSSRKAEVDTTITAEAAAQEAALQQTLTSGGEAPGMKVIFEEAGSKFATEHDFEQSAAASETPGESEVPAAEAWPEAEA